MYITEIASHPDEAFHITFICQLLMPVAKIKIKIKQNDET